ncbi:predicted protein [Streptomyces sp. C]|nr:predicted protein [Streptomyces sp. C]
MPAVRRVQLRAVRAAAAGDPQQPAAAAQPVDPPALGLAHLPEQAVQERGGAAGVGVGVEVHWFHSVRLRCAGGAREGPPAVIFSIRDDDLIIG